MIFTDITLQVSVPGWDARGSDDVSSPMAAGRKRQKKQKILGPLRSGFPTGEMVINNAEFVVRLALFIPEGALPCVLSYR